MLRRLAPGDVVTVTRIDRLARSTFDLFGIIKRIVDAKAQFRSLAEPWADTGTSTGRLMLAVLGGLADVQRGLIRTRTAEGRSRAKAQEKHMGRAQQKDATRRRAQAATLQEWRTATTAAYPPCAARPEPRERISGLCKITLTGPRARNHTQPVLRGFRQGFQNECSRPFARAADDRRSSLL